MNQNKRDFVNKSQFDLLINKKNDISHFCTLIEKFFFKFNFDIKLINEDVWKFNFKVRFFYKIF
jgi:hypothetical protein